MQLIIIIILVFLLPPLLVLACFWYVLVLLIEKPAASLRCRQVLLHYDGKSELESFLECTACHIQTQSHL